MTSADVAPPVASHVVVGAQVLRQALEDLDGAGPAEVFAEALEFFESDTQGVATFAAMAGVKPLRVYEEVSKRLAAREMRSAAVETLKKMAEEGKL